ncbi:YfiR family protein [Cupriavidus basilensis]|uniref:YfiR family protein n=2 Tax=Cupriavidus basilensis TaxID=68895 RepID=A0ABT6B2M9_9BURK|nr:YfiR family protein [Cupriavidus basilensis]MDF3839129.1 YfiR family protein [Cupriavidus basilensis]
MPAATADAARPRLETVAQVVLNLLSYARWPAERDVLRLCVDGSALYTGKLLEGASLPTGRPVQARRVDVVNDGLASDCDSLYLGAMTEARRKKMSAELSGKPVLVIAEHDDECEVVSMFCLDIRDNDVSFRVNLDSVARSGIHIHPGVLQLGRRREPPS